MKNKKTDWTSALRDRLQEARLPVEDAWATEAFLSAAGAAKKGRKAGGLFRRIPATTWSWALAGAAAVFAAVLLLRPASPDAPAPVPRVETPAGPAQEALLAQEIPVSESSPSSSPVQQKLPGPPKRPAAVPASVPEPVPESRESTETSGSREEELQKEAGREERAEQSRNVRTVQQVAVPEAVRPLPGWLEEEEGPEADKKRQPVRLHLHAGIPGRSASGVDSGSSYQSSPYTPVMGTHLAQEDPVILIPTRESQVSLPVPRTFPVSLGVSASLPLSRRWEVAAGLDYTRRLGFVFSEGGHLQAKTYHTLGVPVDLNYYFRPEGQLRFYLGAGVKTEKFLSRASDPAASEPFLYSWNLHAGAEYLVLPNVRLCLTPVFASPITRGERVRTGRDEAEFGLRVALALDL